MDVSALLHDRKVQLVMGAAAAAGAVVLWRRRGTGGTGPAGTTSSGLADSASMTGAGVGAYDSTATDIATQLGQYGAEQQAVLAEYGKTLTDSLAAIRPATPAPAPTAQAPRVNYATQGETLDVLAQRTGLPISRIRAMNGGLKTWDHKRPIPKGYKVWLS